MNVFPPRATVGLDVTGAETAGEIDASGLVTIPGGGDANSNRLNMPTASDLRFDVSITAPGPLQSPRKNEDCRNEYRIGTDGLVRLLKCSSHRRRRYCSSTLCGGSVGGRQREIHADAFAS